MSKPYGPHYQAIRETVREEQPYCGTCSATTGLQCHHRHYDNFPENEKREDLVMLCKECHDAITDVHRRRRDLNLPALQPVQQLPPADRPEVAVEVNVTIGREAPEARVKPIVKEFKV